MRNLEDLYNLYNEISLGEFSNCRVDDIKELASVSKTILEHLMTFADYYEDENLANAAAMNHRAASVTLSNIFEDLDYYTEG